MRKIKEEFDEEEICIIYVGSSHECRSVSRLWFWKRDGRSGSVKGR